MIPAAVGCPAALVLLPVDPEAVVVDVSDLLESVLEASHVSLRGWGGKERLENPAGRFQVQ